MRGFVTADQIVFSVSFRFVEPDEEDDDHHALTTWAGQILPIVGETRQQLKTLWHLVPDLREGEDESEQGWVIAWSGEDRFEKLSSDPSATPPEPPTI